MLSLQARLSSLQTLNQKLKKVGDILFLENKFKNTALGHFHKINKVLQWLKLLLMYTSATFWTSFHFYHHPNSFPSFVNKALWVKKCQPLGLKCSLSPALSFLSFLRNASQFKFMKIVFWYNWFGYWFKTRFYASDRLDNFC